MPYIPKEKFVGRREIWSNGHKRRNESLSLEDSITKWKEDNERMIHIQEKIMHGLKQLQRT